MKAVIQRVDYAKVSVDNETVGEIGKGLLILLGVENGDTETEADMLAEKISKLRIFTDENDKLNLSLIDVSGDALVVSNFTLLANYRHGNRPDYMQAAEPKTARALYEYFTDKLQSKIFGKVSNGAFGEHMKIDVKCNGPVTITMDTDVLKMKRR